MTDPKPANVERTRHHKLFGGWVSYFEHPSAVCAGKMKFTAYVPPQASATNRLPVLYWLSGLTCNEETFMTEGGSQAYAAKHGVILVAPDTSPRGAGVAGETDAYDLGTGAGFYLDATQSKWSKHYRMYSYVTEELRTIAESILPIDPLRRGIFGHSMGGHGALALGLRNPQLYRSISAFAPICAPSRAPWGVKAFTEYLGTDRAAWAAYDANELLEGARGKAPILIDQGDEDEFLKEQLFTDEFERTIATTGYPATVRRQAGYDHGYYFISTFIEDHIAFHAKILKA